MNEEIEKVWKLFLKKLNQRDDLFKNPVVSLVELKKIDLELEEFKRLDFSARYTV